MSRVLFVNLDEGQVIAKCDAEKVGVSAIERLLSGGVRLVCMSSHGAATMKQKFKSHLITEPVIRERHRPISPLW
jgi:predicted mannosyl-3-phosphoglycerate phosphatase (HAD superfamily)